ncbi:MAG: zinc-binding dehydrogenase [Deltaproteobacteria bacterium]|nr:zinc-binding dehydrogenase [Deltaproteobacteria bacterium]
MKAIFFEKHGGPDVLKFGDLPDPEPAAGEALIRVRAVALNYLDIWVRKGWKGLQLEMPHIGGSDVAGEIVSVKAGSGWSEGTKVIVNPGIITAEDEWTRRGEDSVSPGYRILGEHLRGGMAELVVVPISIVFKMPDTRTFEEACAPLLVGTTCWRMLFKRAKLRAGESVLIVGSGGGVNSLAISFAKAAGALVYVLAGTDSKLDKALEIGADHAVNYNKTTNWPVEILKLTRGRGVDVVIDNVGQKTLENSLRAVARGGRIVTVGNTSGYSINFDNRLLFTKQVSLIGSTMGSKQDFIDCMQFMLQHDIKAAIDRVEPLKDGAHMLQRLEEGAHFGKIILKP